MTPDHDVWAALEGAASERGDAVAVVARGLRRTWSEFLGDARSVAAALERLGVQPGERVALLEHNTPAFLAWTFGCAYAGAILVPVNAHLAPREVAAVLEDAEPVVLAAEGDLAELADEAVQLAGGAVTRTPTRVDAAAPEAAPATCGSDDTLHLYYTSGTTGRAKGVPLTRRNVMEHARAACDELALSRTDVWGHIAPMFHLADAWAAIAVTLARGTHAFVARFDAREVLGAIDAFGVTITNLVPTMITRMLHALDGHEGFDGGTLRVLLSGGAPIAPATIQRMLDAFRCEYVQTYGLTETSPYLTLGMLEPRHRELPAAEQLARRARTGRAFGPVELDVVDEHGSPVARDDRTVGEIVARSPTITPGYWRRPDETARAFRDGWFLTGDLATIDDEGWVKIVDRKKDMVLTGGENVYTTEVDNALYEHERVRECATFGVPSDEWGEEVRVAVVADGVTEGELRDHCRARLARFKVPRRVHFVDELPRTGSGKIAKRVLRERFA